MVVQPKIDAAPVAVQLGTYRALIEGGALAGHVITNAGLDKPPTNLRLEDIAVNVEEIPGTSVLRLHVTMKDPSLAAQIANGMADLAVKVNRGLSQDEATLARDSVKELLDQAQKKLDASESDLLAFRSEAQVDIRKKDADAILREREQLLALTVEIGSERARLSRSESELSSQPQLLDVRRPYSHESSLMSAARAAEYEASKKDTQVLGEATAAVPPVGLDSASEFVNPVHEALQYQVSMSRSRLAALQQRQRELIGQRKLNSSQIPLITELYQREAGLARRELEADIAKKAYEDLSLRFDQARAQVTTRSSQLQVVGRAVQSRRPDSPHVLPILAGSVVLGVLAFTGIAFLLEYLAAMTLLENPRTVEDVRT